jgi:hypothetical protein
MPIGKTFEISLEVDGGEASLAGVKIYGYSHADDATVGKSASRRHDQFKGTLYTAKVAYPAGQVPGDATNLGDLVAVAKAAIVDVFGEVFAEPKVEAPVAAPVVEAKVARGGRGKKAEAHVAEPISAPVVEAKVEEAPAKAPQADYPDFVEGAGAGEAEVIAEAEELQTGDE